jgi:hypothetical protein
MKNLVSRLEQLEQSKNRSRVVIVHAFPSDNAEGVRYEVKGKEVHLSDFQENDKLIIDNIRLQKIN